MKVMDGWRKSSKNNYFSKRIMNRRYSSAGPHNKSFMCRHYHGAYFVCLFMLAITGAALLNSNSVSAAPGTLTINIPDTISLDVLPSASGTFASTSSNITVRTTYAHGYTLGIAASTANSNALINTNDSSKTIPSITSAISESTFSGNTSYNNKWGYSPSKYNSATNTNYLVAPTSTTMATLDKTSAANSTDNTYTIKLGARIDGTLAPGTYENTFVFTVTANPTPYTITYNQNTTDTVTNMPSNVNSSTYDETVTLANTVPVREGYTFKGWCTTQTADGGTCSGTTYNPDGGGTNLTWTLDQTAATNSLTIYAMWASAAVGECTDTATCMQTMSECPTTATTVTDARDGNTYKVQKLADNNCWMLDNLALDPTQLTQAELYGSDDQPLTNATNTTLGYLKNGGGTTSDKYPTAKLNNVAWTSSSQNYYSIPMVITSYIDTVPLNSTLGVGSRKVGVYYNYCAASAGSYCYGNGTDAGTSSGNATESLCPYGWRLPTGNSSGEYGKLYSTSSYNYNTYDKFKTALSLPLSGVFYSGSAYNQGGLGYWWTSTRSVNSDMYRLYIGASTVYAMIGYDRYRGISIRCVLGS